MSTFEITISVLTLAAILIGPVVAVAITLWHDGRREKRDTKKWLFLTLIAYRKSSPPAGEWVSALNQIDVVFYDVPGVRQAWREYLESLEKTPEAFNAQAANHRHLDLLHAMAEHLGYPKIKQTDLDRFYAPSQYGAVANIQTAIQYEWLRVLENTSHLVVAPLPASTEQVAMMPPGSRPQDSQHTSPGRTA